MKNIGKEGEDIAAEFLRKKGYIIIEKNYRTPFGEIDLIAKDGNTIVFAEVKTRTDNSYVRPFEAVDWRKRNRMKKVALIYLKRFKDEVPARFDVLSIDIKGNKNIIEYFQNAFEI